MDLLGFVTSLKKAKMPLKNKHLLFKNCQRLTTVRVDELASQKPEVSRLQITPNHRSGLLINAGKFTNHLRSQRAQHQTFEQKTLDFST